MLLGTGYFSANPIFYYKQKMRLLKPKRDNNEHNQTMDIGEVGTETK